jgi:hypothetical protein
VIDLTDASAAWLLVENEAQTGTLVNDLVTLEAPLTEGVVTWDPDGSEFDSLAWAATDKNEPKVVRAYVRIYWGGDDYYEEVPEFGGYAYVYPDIPAVP